MSMAARGESAARPPNPKQRRQRAALSALLSLPSLLGGVPIAGATVQHCAAPSAAAATTHSQRWSAVPGAPLRSAPLFALRCSA